MTAVISNTQMLITLAAVIGAGIAIYKYFSSVVRWVDRQHKQDEEIKSIKEELSESYRNAKNDLVEFYLNTTTDICTQDKELCDSAKSDFN